MPPRNDPLPAKSKIGGKLKQITFGSLAIIGVMAIVWHGVLPLFHEKAYAHKTLLSPSGKYKAVLFNWNGGGGLSPYCYNSISVVPAAVSDDAANHEGFRVYSGGCHAVGDSDYAPTIKWLSDVELEITYDLAQAVHGVSSVGLKGSAASGQVFVIHRNVIPFPQPNPSVKRDAPTALHLP